MRTIIAILAAFALTAGTAAASPEDTKPFAKDSADVVALLDKAAATISGTNIYDCIQQITTDPLNLYRVMGTPSHKLFVDRHAKVWSTLSPRLKDQVVPFANGGANPGGAGSAIPDGGYNIIGVLPGKDLQKWIVLGGHYDTREATIGGAAIDNTSGICTVKELARAFLTLNVEPEATIVFAWWDGEEWGLYGARAFVADHNATKQLLGLTKESSVEILMGHSYDIVGVNYPAYNTWVNYGQQTNVMEYAVLNLRTPPIGEGNLTLCPNYGCYTKLQERDDFDDVVMPKFHRYNGLAKEVAQKFLKLPDEFVQVRDDKYGRSDHVPFTAAGIPGMRIQGSHDGQWPHYHQPSDTLPAAVSMAGGVDKLQAGFKTAASAGGLTAFYIALTGGLGGYADLPVPAVEGCVLPVNATLTACPSTNAIEKVPATAPWALVTAIAMLVLVLRRRRF